MTRISELVFVQLTPSWEGVRLPTGGAVYRALQSRVPVSIEDESDYHDTGEYVICDRVDPRDMTRFQDERRVWAHLDEISAQAIVCYLLGEGTDEN